MLGGSSAEGGTGSGLADLAGRALQLANERFSGYKRPPTGGAWVQVSARHGPHPQLHMAGLLGGDAASPIAHALLNAKALKLKRYPLHPRVLFVASKGASA